MTRGVDNAGDGNCHCKATLETMYLRITWKIQSVSPIGFPVFVFVFEIPASVLDFHCAESKAE